MSFRNAFLGARHHIIVILGLLTAAGLISMLQTVPHPAAPMHADSLVAAAEIPSARRGVLSEEQAGWARVAWRYFQRNGQQETGLVNAVDGRAMTTMWDTASYLLGMISAYRLGIIDDLEFDQRLGRALHSLAKIPLFEGRLPNRSYNTVTLAMVDSEGQASDHGSGWSAIEIARLLIPLNIIVWNYPTHAGEVRAVVQRWQFDELVRGGVLIGAGIDKQGQTEYLREGRFGYEAYAAKSIALMGFDVSKAANFNEYLGFADIYGIRVPIDKREPDKYSTHNYVVGEPYILDGVEFGWDLASRGFAYRIFQAQEQRFKDAGVLTAASSGPVDVAPYFVYNTVFAEGTPWNALMVDGKDASDLRFLSAGDAIGWYALYDADYSQRLADKAGSLFDPEQGWYSGWYEAKARPNKTINANTNAMVLESLHYRQFGRLVAVYAADESTGSVATEPESEAEQATDAAPNSAIHSGGRAHHRAGKPVAKAHGKHSAAKPKASRQSKKTSGKKKAGVSAGSKVSGKHVSKSAHSGAKAAKKRR